MFSLCERTFTCAGVSETIDVPPRKAFIYDKVSEVAAQTSQAYCIPKSKTAESVDFICQPGELGQVTINLRHGAKAPGLQNAYSALTGPLKSGYAWLTFVVPPDRFANYKLQQLKSLDLTRFTIKQRVMKLQISSRLSTKPAFCFI